MSSEKTYEMMWDCPYCGSRKLLGKTHRHCPSCGAPQDPTGRYFPPDSEKVAVEDHAYVGADLICASCQNASSRIAKHCGNCGAPLDAAASARLRAEQAHPDGVAFAGESSRQAREELQGGSPAQAPSPAKSKKSALGCVIAAVAVLGLVAASILVVLTLFRKDAELQVAGHAWRREIAVERFGQVRESEWCERMPSGATSVVRKKEVRSTKKVPDGEECVMKKTDRGDGTYKEKKECKPKYKEEPVYEDKCEYWIGKWQKSRTEVASGTSVSDALRWPEPKLVRTGTCDGCERSAARTEVYTVRFSKKGGGEGSCDFDQNKWMTFKVGASVSGKANLVTGSLDCDTLQQR